MSFDGVKTVFKKIIFVLAMLMISASTGNAAPDSKGTDFWLTFPQNYFGDPQLTLFIAGDTATTGTVTGPGMTPTNFSVTPGTVTVVNIPPSAELTTSDTVENKGIHVTAQNEVTVYGLNHITATTDAYLGLPTDILGTEYIVLAYSTFGPEFAIVGTADTTTVTITPSADAGSQTAGVPFNINLNQGDTYQLQSFGDDLSGTIITSDKPIAVFGGAICADIPPSAGACDHVVEELSPTETWGKSFVTVPLATRANGDTFRFLASADGTNVTVNGTLVATLNRGQFHERIIDSAAVITSDKPILVAQYSNGCSFDSACGPDDGDPFMMLIPPFEQFLAQYTVSTPDAADNPEPQFPANFANVVAPNTAVGAIKLDGTAIPSASFTAISTSGFSGAQVSLSQGSHTLSGPLPFGAFLYGFGFFDSYGYPGGLSLAPVARVTNVSLAPKTATNPVGTEHCITATVTDQNNAPLNGVRVDFNVTGANQTAGFVNTDTNGQAQFCYTGQNSGQDTITAAVGDISDTATKDWTGGENTPPAADPQPAVTTPEDTPKQIKLTGSDADGDPLTFSIVTPPQHGDLSELTIASAKQKSKPKPKHKKPKGKPGPIAAVIPSTGANNVTYTPDPNYNGPDFFTFKVNDGKADSAEARVDITVTPVNDPAQIQTVTLERRTSPTAGYSYSTPGIAAVLEFLNVDGDNSVSLTLPSIKAKNVPKGCGANVLPSDEVTIAPPAIVETIPIDSQGEIKVVEIGLAGMALATQNNCQVTLELTAFSIRTTDNPSVTFVLSETLCIDSDGGAVYSCAPTVVAALAKQPRANRAAIKIAPPAVR
jgi:hypothetical protein